MLTLMRGDRALPSMLRSAGVQGLIILMNVATGIITARLLGADGRGIYAAITLWPPLLGMLATAGLSSAVTVCVRRAPGDAGQIVGAALLLGLAYMVLATLAGEAMLPHFLANYDADTVSLARLCLAAVAVNVVQIVMRQYFAGSGQYLRCNLMHLLPQLLHLVLLLLAVWWGLDAGIAAVALFLGGALAVLAMLPGFIASARPTFSGALARLKALQSYSLRAAPGGVVTAFALYADRLVLLPLLPAAELGLYAVAYSFSRLIQFIQPALQSIFLSHLSGQDAAGGKIAHDHAVRFLLITLAVGCGLLWIAGEWLLTFMYGSAFADAVAAFRILVIEASFGVLAQLTLQLYLASDRPGFASAVQGATLAVSVLLLLALVPTQGGQGAAIALAVASGLRWLVLLLALRPVLGLAPPRMLLNRADWRYLASRLR